MTSASDAGGVAARLGFKFQDHVAALFVLQMIGDRRILQVECETSDDITVKWNGQQGAFPEYVQVKTTDRDTKWSLTEITKRNPSSTPSSLVERSLLADAAEAGARFRIVARRGVGKPLAALAEPIGLRAPGSTSSVAAKLLAKFPKTRSANGHDLSYWATNAFWQVISGVENLQSANLQTISRLAEEHGANPSHSHAKSIYADLLRVVEEAALASKKQPSEFKIISRPQALLWWEKHLASTTAAQRRTSKPYRTRGAKFLAQIHEIRDAKLVRLVTGYDAQYEQKVWRSRQLAKYLVDWIPEVALKASELVEIDQLNLRQKIEAGLRKVQSDRDLRTETLMGATLLHAVMRHWFGSEPIACKLFHKSALGDQVVTNAHVVHSEHRDELWLGRVRFFDGKDVGGLVRSLREELIGALSVGLLSEERQIILQLREPQHTVFNALDDALDAGSPVDELIRALCLPIMIAYDSAVLATGFSQDYRCRLKKEIDDIYASFANCFPPMIEEVRVHVFFVPIESLKNLQSHFEEALGLDALQ